MEKVNRTLALSYSGGKCTETKGIVVVHPLLSYGEGAHLESAHLPESKDLISDSLPTRVWDNPLGLSDLAPETVRELRRLRSVQGSRR